MYRTLLAALILLFTSSTPVTADDLQPPVAVRWWGQSLVTIETYWNLTIAIDPYTQRVGYQLPDISADAVLVTHEHFDHNNVNLIKGNPSVVAGLEGGNVADINVALDRPANTDRAQLLDLAQNPDAISSLSPHAVRIKSIASFHDDEYGRYRGRNAMFLIEVNDVRILHAGDLGQTQLTDEQLQQIGTLDVLLIPVGGVFTVSGEQARDITRQINPRFVVPIHYKTPPLTIDLQPVDAFVDEQTEQAVGNTLAVSAADNAESHETQAVVLKYEPWKMPVELVNLFDRKEQAAASSAAVFAELSTNQMNHRPINGTHTPRWNAEHMMAREFGFFSSFYHGVDPSVPEMDLNPQQQPPDYEAAHPDWPGKEEARQIERVQAFSRRFAYLFDGVDPDAKFKHGPTWWTPRELLQQMINHWGEHTENVKEKFDQPDWPAE